MQLAIDKSALQDLVARQLETLFILDREHETDPLIRGIDEALKRSEYCFSRTADKYYSHDGETYFNPFHAGQYCIFLYFLANSIHVLDDEPATLADRVYYLNRCLNGVDLFYEVSLPKVFFLDHPLGSVIGRATYGEYFSFTQNCTVGNNKGAYPTIGTHVRMMSGAKIVGDCEIGDNVTISANTYIKDQSVPSDCLVFGSSPNLVLKSRHGSSHDGPDAEGPAPRPRARAARRAAGGRDRSS
jgi:serine O-acetyltransferase